MKFDRKAAGAAVMSFFGRLREDVGIRVLIYQGIIERKTDPLLERNFHLLKILSLTFAGGATAH